ncbi:MAG: septal ring lytic transglycosylase RlpA family protein [Bryobacteraceae bacterium]
MASGTVRAYFAIAMIAVFGAASCGKKHARVSTPRAPAKIGEQETGIASWYGVPYHGRRTASGEVYDMEQLTAAHKKLPFQTWVEVTNLENGKSVDVRITDRGPFIRGRIIDLSHRAANDIDMLGPGIAKVRLKVIRPPKDLPVAPTPETIPPEAGATEATSARSNTPAPAPRDAVYRPDVAAKPESSVSATPSSSTPSSSTPLNAQPSRGRFAVQAGAFSDKVRAESLRSQMADIYMDARVVPSGRLWKVLVGSQLTQDQASSLATKVRREFGDSVVVGDGE